MTRVLFVGCSLTYANDMPLIVQAFARSVGQTLEVATAVKGGASLEDHWKRGGALTRIKEGGWNVVVLQQGPSSLSESRASQMRAAGTRGAGDSEPARQCRAAAAFGLPRRQGPRTQCGQTPQPRQERNRGVASGFRHRSKHFRKKTMGSRKAS